MAYYYAYTYALAQTSGTPNTLLDMLRMTTATQVPAAVAMVSGGAVGTTVGGIVIRGGRFITASTVGTGVTPLLKNPKDPAASTVIATLPTAGTTYSPQISLGLPATGGMGVWAALDPDQFVKLDSNGGANGNFDWQSYAPIATATFDFTPEWWEF